MAPFNAVLALLLAEASLLRQAPPAQLVRTDTAIAPALKPPAAQLVHAGAKQAPVKSRQRLSNFQNTQYYGEITVGQQVLHGIFDTGSFELLVLSARCESCGRVAYNHTLSNTYTTAPGNNIKEFHFGSGPTLTAKGFEKVVMGPYTIQSMPIWEIIDHEIPVLEVSQLDAIVGIGPGEEDREVPSLMEEFGISRYSVCLEQADQAPGWFIWNDEDPALRTGFFEVPVVGKVHWGVHLTNARIGDQVFGCDGQGCGAVLDSGTSLIAAPHESLLHLASALDTLNPDCSNMAAMPSLFFELGGKTVELPPQAYIARMVGVIPPSIWDVLSFKPESQVVMQCVPLLMDLDSMMTEHGPLWIVGMPFFRYYYTTFSFDTRQVHLAHASAACEPLPGIPGATSMVSHEQEAPKPITINPATLRLPQSPGDKLVF